MDTLKNSDVRASRFGDSQTRPERKHANQESKTLGAVNWIDQCYSSVVHQATLAKLGLSPTQQIIHHISRTTFSLEEFRFISRRSHRNEMARLGVVGHLR